LDFQGWNLDINGHNILYISHLRFGIYKRSASLVVGFSFQNRPQSDLFTGKSAVSTPKGEVLSGQSVLATPFRWVKVRLLRGESEVSTRMDVRGSASGAEIPSVLVGT
jgi:hypothetical protein